MQPANRGIFRAQGGISQCKQEPDVFSFVRNPRQPTRPLIDKDTLKAYEREKNLELERQALAKVQIFNFINSDVVGRAGKFVFHTITLPPYIALIGLPKWIMTEFGPWLTLFITNAIKTPFNFFKSISKRSLDLASHVLKKAINPFQIAFKRTIASIAHLQELTKALFVSFKHRIVKTYEKNIEWMQSVIQATLAPFITVTHRLQQMVFSWSKLTKVKFQPIKLRFQRFTQSQKNRLNTRLQALNIFFKKTHREKLSALKTQIAAGALAAKTRIKRLTKPLIDVSETAAKEIVKQVFKAKEAIQQTLLTAVLPLQRTSEQLADVTMNFSLKWGAKVINLYDETLRLLRQVQEPIKKNFISFKHYFSLQKLQVFKSSAQQFIGSFKESFTRHFQQTMSLVKRVVKKAQIQTKETICTVAAKIYQFFKHLPYLIYAYIQNFFQRIENIKERLGEKRHSAYFFAKILYTVAKESLQQQNAQIFKKLSFYKPHSK